MADILARLAALTVVSRCTAGAGEAREFLLRGGGRGPLASPPALPLVCVVFRLSLPLTRSEKDGTLRGGGGGVVVVVVVVATAELLLIITAPLPLPLPFPFPLAPPFPPPLFLPPRVAGLAGPCHWSKSPNRLPSCWLSWLLACVCEVVMLELSGLCLRLSPTLYDRSSLMFGRRPAYCAQGHVPER